MKKIIISYLLSFVTVIIAAQNSMIQLEKRSIPSLHGSGSIHLVFTSTQDTYENNASKEGKFRSERDPQNVVYNYPPIRFSFISKSKNIRETLTHYSYNTDELAKIRTVNGMRDRMSVIYLPKSTFSTVSYIDMDIEFPKMTEESAKAFFYELRGRIVYIIDRRLQPDNGEVLLLETKLTTSRSYGDFDIPE